MSVGSLNLTKLRLNGLSSGLDTDSIVTSLLKVDQYKVDKQFKAKTKLEWKGDALREVNNALKTFRQQNMSVLNSANNKIKDRIASIRKLGVKLAMDDFGMGHSSLMYLKEYAFDTIKLDGSLVRELVNNKNCRDIVSSIVTLGKSLHYDVIAEFVERQEQRLVLHDLGCNRYQGYLFSCALPFEEMVEFVAKGNN